MMENAIQWWRTLARRERNLISAALGVVGFALVYLIAFEPAWEARKQLQKELPALRAEVSRMDNMASEARRLAAVPVSTDSPQTRRMILEQSIVAAGLKPYLAQLTMNGELIDARFKAVPFALWVAWLDAAVRQTRLRIVDAAVQREAVSGLVTARLALEPPAQEVRQ